LTTLTLGGMIFVGVLTVRASAYQTIEDALDYWKYDVELQFSRPYKISLLEREALRVPGVVKAESWGFGSARRLRDNDTESDNVFMVAPPADTQFLQPTILEGRWLLPDDGNAVVVNTDLVKDEPDVKVGDEIVLKLDNRETTWRVVGLAKGVLSGPIVYANYPTYSNVVRSLGRAGSIQIVTEGHDAASQEAVGRAVEDHFESLGMRVSNKETTSSIRQRIQSQFDIIVVFLAIMAVLLALVGGLGLMGTMSINVLERTREIGVMRAVGASDGAVLRIGIVEGVLIGALSWFLGTALSFPMSKLLSDAVGVAFVKAPLSYTFSLGGAALWLGLVIALAALASFLPAHNASRLTVREVLAYE
jgi:putative ABC transport system permease protein